MICSMHAVKMEKSGMKRKGGAEKAREKKKKALAADAENCTKLTELFGVQRKSKTGEMHKGARMFLKLRHKM